MPPHYNLILFLHSLLISIMYLYIQGNHNIININIIYLSFPYYIYIINELFNIVLGIMGRNNRGMTKTVGSNNNNINHSSIANITSFSCTTFNILAPIYKRITYEVKLKPCSCFGVVCLVEFCFETCFERI